MAFLWLPIKTKNDTRWHLIMPIKYHRYRIPASRSNTNTTTNFRSLRVLLETRNYIIRIRLKDSSPRWRHIVPIISAAFTREKNNRNNNNAINWVYGSGESITWWWWVVYKRIKYHRVRESHSDYNKSLGYDPLWWSHHVLVAAGIMNNVVHSWGKLSNNDRLYYIIIQQRCPATSTVHI